MPTKQTIRVIFVVTIAVLLIFLVQFSFTWLLQGPSSPLYAISNEDTIPHNVTITIVKSDGQSSIHEYSIGPRDHVEIDRSLSLELNNPFKSSDWQFHIESENISSSYNMTPHRVNTVFFRLFRAGGEFNIMISEDTV